MDNLLFPNDDTPLQLKPPMVFKYVGYYTFDDHRATLIPLIAKPSWFHRFCAKTLLGMKWVDQEIGQ